MGNGRVQGAYFKLFGGKGELGAFLVCNGQFLGWYTRLQAMVMAMMVMMVMVMPMPMHTHLQAGQDVLCDLLGGQRALLPENGLLGQSSLHAVKEKRECVCTCV